jgi:hypothetical protein
VSSVKGRMLSRSLLPRSRSLLSSTDEALKSLTRRGGRVSLGSDGANRRRLALDDGTLVVCLVVLAGLVVLGSVLILLSWVTATLPSSMLRSYPEFDGCVSTVPDGNEFFWVDDPLSDAPGMRR